MASSDSRRNVVLIDQLFDILYTYIMFVFTMELYGKTILVCYQIRGTDRTSNATKGGYR